MAAGEGGAADEVTRPRTTSHRSDRLVGRTEPLGHLRDRLATVRATFVVGEAGIGKTRLVTAALADTIGTPLQGRRPGLAVLRGGADPLRRDRPFGAVLEALGTLDRSASDAERDLDSRVSAPDVGAVVGPGGRGPMGEAIVAIVRERARRRPAAFVVEDLQWADPGSLEVVAELCDPVPGADVAVVGTWRPVPRNPALDHLVEMLVPGSAIVVTLGALASDEVVALVTALVGAPPTPDLQAYVARAGGNPLFVTELVEALAEQGSLVRTDDGVAVTVSRASLPPDLRVTLLRRLSALPPATVEALRSAALLGGSFAVGELAAALAASLPVVLERLQPALQAGWLGPRGDDLAFRHELVRDAIQEDTAPGVRRGLHRHLAERLRELGADDTVVARHLLLGAAAPDPVAAAWLHDIGRRVALRDPAFATEILRGAADLVPPRRRRDAIALDLGVAQLWSSATAAGEATLRELWVRPHDASVDAAAGLALSRSLVLGGRTEEAVAILRDTSARADGADERSLLDAELALTHLLRGDLRDATDVVAQVETAWDVASDEARCLARCIRCALEGLAADPRAAMRHVREALDIAAVSADPETSRRPPQLFLGSLLLDVDRFDEGFAELDLARRISERLGAVWDAPLQHLLTARGRLHVGDLDDAVAEAETSLRLAEEQDTHVLEVWAHALVAHARFDRLDLDAARAAVAAGEEAVTRYGVQVRGTDWLVWARARLLEADGETAAARSAVAAIWDAYVERGVVSDRRHLGPELTRLHVDAGDHAAAREVAEATAEAAARSGVTTFRAAAEHATGLVTADVDRLLATVTLTRDTRARPMHVQHTIDAADALARSGRRDDAVAHYEEARTVAETTGAARQVRRAEAGLRELGVRLGVRGTRVTRPAVGWDALTPTEVTVTELAAAGRSNPEIGATLFISRRTVQTHLSHVFAKLGVTSRVELARRVADRDRAG